MSFFVPGKKERTSKNREAELDLNNPIVKASYDILLLNGGAIPPVDELNGNVWSADTSNGSEPYSYQDVNGSISLTRQDLDENGITYGGAQSPVDTNINPHFFALIYTILVTPTDSYQSIIQRSNIPRSGTPAYGFNSVNATSLQFYANGGGRFINIPVTPGKTEIVFYRYDGNSKHHFYTSAKGYWETYEGGSRYYNSDDVFWLGSGYNRELPCAFELVINRAGHVPSLDDCKSFVQNPYQILKPQRKFIVFGATGGGTTLTADVGAFSLSGQDAILKSGLKLTSDVGAFILSGQDATLTYGEAATAYILTADVGSFNLTGQDANLLYNRLLSSDTGSFNLTGQGASFNYGRLLNTDNGVFNLTGHDANLIYTQPGSYILTGDKGIFNLSGQDSNLIKSNLLPVDAGGFTLTGIIAGLKVGKALGSLVGEFLHTGQEAIFRRTYKLIADTGGFNLLGQGADLIHGIINNYILTADVGSFLLEGQNATLSYGNGLGFINRTVFAKQGNIDVKTNNIITNINSK